MIVEQLSRFQGTHFRIIASKYPPIEVFEDLNLDPQESRLAFALEALTNDRLQKPLARLTRLPDSEIVTGSGSGYVMAAFLHGSESGGRFNGPDLGAWYSALSIETAVAETAFHNHRRLAFSEDGFPNEFDMRVLSGRLDLTLVDLRGLQTSRPDLYDPRPERYGPGQSFADDIRLNGVANGLAYDSVRDDQGVCICLFWPTAVSLPIIQERHLRYYFDAEGVFSYSVLT